MTELAPKFKLTDAVAPVKENEFNPKSGYVHRTYYDRENDTSIPVLVCAVSSENILDLFFDLVDPVGKEVQVVLDYFRKPEKFSYWRDHIDLPVAKSTLLDFEDLLLNDGFMALTVLNPQARVEVQMDDHKILYAYANDLSPFEEILADHSIECDEAMPFLFNVPHLHYSDVKQRQKFEELKQRLGIDE